LIGYLLGPVAAFVALYFAVRMLLLAEKTLWGFPDMPPCHGQSWSSTGEQVAIEHGYLLTRCTCGRCFTRARKSVFSPSEVFEVFSDGSIVPYMRWRPFRGWTSTGPFRATPRRLTDS
jgi:hypothetical protein